MTLTYITQQVALAINSSSCNTIEKFVNEATCCEYMLLTHYNFFYSYPAWGKKWNNGKISQFHRVHTKCHHCDYMPERNHAGIGNIYMLHNGINDSHIAKYNGMYKNEKGKEKRRIEYIPNTPRLSPMILLCPNHLSSFIEWSPIRKGVKQLELF